MRYDFDEVIDRRGTYAENVEGFRQYMFPGKDMKFPVPDDELIRMWVADMEFAVAPEICDAIRKRTDHRIFGYTGVFGDGYHDVFAGWCRDRYGWRFPKEELVFSQGVVPALYGLVEEIMKAEGYSGERAGGGRGLFLTPAYGPFGRAFRYSGHGYVTSAMTERNGMFTVDLEDLAAKAADPEVKILIWCNPHNPTGRVWSGEEAQSVAKIVRDNDLWIISDEIHCDLLRCGEHHTPMGKVMPEYEKLITCMAASKTFNLAGLMFSNIIIRDEALRRAFVRNDKTGGMVNPISLAANMAAYEHGGPWLEELRAYLDENFRFAVDFINENIPGASCGVPQATYLLWVDMRGCDMDTEDLSGFFAEKAGVLVEGGNRLFIGNAEGFVRINLAMPRTLVKEGLERMAEAAGRYRR